MSIIDWLIMLIAGGLGAAAFLVGLIVIAIVRWWMRSIDGHDEIARKQRLAG